MKKNNIGVLITIILLLIICLPASIYGLFTYYQNGGVIGNPEHKFYYEGSLYFYDNNKKLLGTYKCNTTNCGYAKNYIAETYEVDNYNVLSDDIELINNHFAFIEDGEEIVLYNVLEGTKLISYQAVKHNSVGINDNYYIVKNSNNLWGMIEVSNNVNLLIPYNYNYMGILNDTSNNKNDASRIVAHKNNEWYLLNNKNNILFSTPEEITYFNNAVIVTKANGRYTVIDYNKNNLFPNYSLSNVSIKNNYVIATTNSNYYIIYNYITKISSDAFIKKINSTYDFQIENDKLVVKENGTIIKTIA